MPPLSAYHQALFDELLRSRIVQREDGKVNKVLEKWEHIYEGVCLMLSSVVRRLLAVNLANQRLRVQAYSRWKQDNASPTAYATLGTIHAYLKGDGHFSRGDLWSRHLLVRCFILEARKSDSGTRPVKLRGEAFDYCTDLNIEFGNAKEPLVSFEEIMRMEDLVKMEQSVFETQPHPSALGKVKAKAFHLFVKRMRLE
ncbi:MAG: hypothetical protein Q9226_007925 [Calogaya cf. arnoldii]